MKRTRKAAVSLAIAAGALVPVGLATSAQAVPVTHDGCTLTVDKPAFTDHWTLGGTKQVDYVYHLTCGASAAGVSVEVKHERWESDLANTAGDPDTVDDFQNSSTQNLNYGSAGGNKNRTIRVALPVAGDDDTDGDYEMYQKVKFRVTSGAVTGTWSPANLSAARTISA